MKTHASFRGEVWHVDRVPSSTLGGDRSGDTDYDTNTIQLHKRLKGKARLETECHEALHALYPDLSEEAVTEGGRDLARFLWNTGYRVQKN